MEALKFEGSLEKKIIAGKRDEKTVASNAVLKARWGTDSKEEHLQLFVIS